MKSKPTSAPWLYLREADGADRDSTADVKRTTCGDPIDDKEPYTQTSGVATPTERAAPEWTDRPPECRPSQEQTKAGDGSPVMPP